MAEPSAGSLPKPGAFITPQAGGVLQKEVERFFDPATYTGKTAGLPPMGHPGAMTDLTPETIRKFFDPATYQRGRTTVFSSPCSTFSEKMGSPGQKRLPEHSPVPHPAAKARLGKTELVEKFKMAAELNGISWDDLLVT